MKVVESGHIYLLNQIGTDEQIEMKFRKSSSGAIQYDEEWHGLQTQEVLRALIERTEYLYWVLPCKETKRALKHLRKALYQYEVRAYRRKQQQVNKTKHTHDSTGDIPFEWDIIEHYSVGKDGYICYENS